MIQIDAQKLIDEKLTSEELFLYLRENMEDPSANIYEDAYRNVIGFTACDIHGNIVSTSKVSGSLVKFNSTKQAVRQNKILADNRHSLAEAWKEKAKDLENSLHHTRVFTMIVTVVLAGFIFHCNKNLQELNKLRPPVDKWANKSVYDNLVPLTYKDTIR